MKSDGTHQMTLVSSRKGTTVTWSLTCNDCPKKFNSLNGDDGKATLSASLRSHAAVTKAIADAAKRKGGKR